MIGHQAPAFSLPATGGKTIALADLHGKTVVLYFYPKDSTPGCTREGQDFATLHDAFVARNSVVLGISRDSMKSHENFKTKQDFPFDLLSDAEETVCNAFGVIKLKNMYGKQVRGIERSTFVIDAQGIVRQAWRGVKVPDHAQEVLDFVSTL